MGNHLLVIANWEQQFDISMNSFCRLVEKESNYSVWKDKVEPKVYFNTTPQGMCKVDIGVYFFI